MWYVVCAKWSALCGTWNTICIIWYVQYHIYDMECWVCMICYTVCPLWYLSHPLYVSIWCGQYVSCSMVCVMWDTSCFMWYVKYIMYSIQYSIYIDICTCMCVCVWYQMLHVVRFMLYISRMRSSWRETTYCSSILEVLCKHFWFPFLLVTSWNGSNWRAVRNLTNRQLKEIIKVTKFRQLLFW